MHANYQEISSLYHHGIKGQKWGVIRKSDDQATRLASEKNRLKYDEKIAQIKNESDTSVTLNKQNNETTIILGKQELAKALSEDSRLRKESYNERKAKEQKYKTLGLAAVLGLFAVRTIAKNYRKRDIGVTKYAK